MGLKDGFYWAKFYPAGEWEVVRYFKNNSGAEYVYVNNEELPYEKDELFEFDQNRLLTPDEIAEINEVLSKEVYA